MSKKNFVALADKLIELKPLDPSNTGRPILFATRTARFHQWEETVAVLATFCQQQNGNFNRERWIGYILGENGPNGGEVKGK